MGTITITSAGFAATPASQPANWPAGVAYPGAVAPNGSKAFTVSDADMLRLISWTANSQGVAGIGSSTPTMAQILLAYIQIWRNGTVQGIQTLETVPAVAGTPITMA